MGEISYDQFHYFNKVLENSQKQNGHEHTLSYPIRHNRDYLILGSTGGRPVEKILWPLTIIDLLRMAKATRCRPSKYGP